MLWKREVALEIMGYSRNHIDAIISEQDTGFKWRMTGFYGNSETHRRQESWDELVALNRKFQLPWLCYGDFNEILSGEERWVGCLGPKGKWIGFVRWLILAGSKTWGIVVRILHGATCKRGLIAFT